MRRLLSPACGAAVLIVLGVVCVYGPALGNGFVGWDDDRTLLGNPHFRGLSPAHLRWMFTTMYMGHYQPLSWISLALDHAIWGMDPTGYHLTSLLLHAANAVLLFVLLGQLWAAAPGGTAGRGRAEGVLAASLAALLWALHPLRVESVAWATERRDVLSGLFYLSALIAYLQLQRAGSGRGRLAALAGALVCLLLSLLSKAWGITLPLVLLALDVYPLRRLSWRDNAPGAVSRVLREKAPFFLLAAAGALVALVAQHQSHALRTLQDHGPLGRLMQASYGMAFYVGKVVMPLALSPLYPLDSPMDPLAPVHVLCAAGVVLLSGALVYLRHRAPWAAAAWLCYVLIALPVLGLAQSGPQIAADRYTYLATLPFAALAGAGLRAALTATAGERWRRRGLLGVALGILSLLVLQTSRQIPVWKDSLTLWGHAVRLDPRSHRALGNRASARQAAGDLAGAIRDYDAALALRPGYTSGYRNRGVARMSLGDLRGALADFDQAIRLQPADAAGYFLRAAVYKAQGDPRRAVADLDQAILRDPRHGPALNNRGNARRAAGDLRGALADFDAAITAQPADPKAYNNRGLLHKQAGQAHRALQDFDRAIRLAPDYAEALANRGMVLQALGARGRAAADYAAALRLAPPRWPHQQTVRRLLRSLSGRGEAPRP